MTVSPTARLEASQRSHESFEQKRLAYTHWMEFANCAMSRRRDCHSTAPASRFSRCVNRDGEGVSAK